MTQPNETRSDFYPPKRPNTDLCYIGPVIVLVGLIAANWRPTVGASFRNFFGSQQSTYRGWPFSFLVETTNIAENNNFRMSPWGPTWNNRSVANRLNSQTFNLLLLFENIVIGALLMLGTGIGLHRLLVPGNSSRLFQYGILATCTLVVLLANSYLMQTSKFQRVFEGDGLAYQIIPMTAKFSP